jgi:hypothetical protein
MEEGFPHVDRVQKCWKLAWSADVKVASKYEDMEV